MSSNNNTDVKTDPQIVPLSSEEHAAPSKIMSQDELAEATAMIQSYSGYPGVTAAFSNIISAHANNPEQLTALMRELVDTIEQVKSNPHANYPVNPAIASAVDAVRKVELEKPDPLNLLRNSGQSNEQDQPQGGMGLLSAIVGGAAAGAAIAGNGGGLDLSAGAPAAEERYNYADLGKEYGPALEKAFAFGHGLDGTGLDRTRGRENVSLG